jgi:hypothetical protein
MHVAVVCLMLLIREPSTRESFKHHYHRLRIRTTDELGPFSSLMKLEKLSGFKAPSA